GVGIKIDDFLELVDQSLTEAHGDFPNRHHIRNAAIKFDMLRYDTFQDVIFDVTATLNYKGFTGPYIQYTHARANSLLTKADYQPDLNQVEQLTALMQTLVPTDPALAVVRLLYKFPETVIDAALKYAPNLLCVYLYELCQAYNSFYNGSPVLQAETSKLKQFRLLVTAATKQVIANGLYLLGITAVDKM
ncbi:hypothetical protein KJ605_02700, partial [Patescibacteria group bacterium]|nr:hypothetical protein [Patescibacteria group bacterium]MBU1970655.1 hypothetical protein [Patescibacteria group bacterium]